MLHMPPTPPQGMLGLRSSPPVLPPPASDLELTCTSTTGRVDSHDQAVCGDAAVDNDRSRLRRDRLRPEAEDNAVLREGKPLRTGRRRPRARTLPNAKPPPKRSAKSGRTIPALVKMLNDKERRVRPRSRLKLWAWALKPCLQVEGVDSRSGRSHAKGGHQTPDPSPSQHA